MDKYVVDTYLIHSLFKTFAEYKNKLDRRKQADATAWSEGKQLLKAKFKVKKVAKKVPPIMARPMEELFSGFPNHLKHLLLTLVSVRRAG